MPQPAPCPAVSARMRFAGTVNQRMGPNRGFSDNFTATRGAAPGDPLRYRESLRVKSRGSCVVDG